MDHLIPYVIAFLASLALTFVLTPIVREMNRRLGMVDEPSARRVNTVPVPRGGGLAVMIGVAVSYSIFLVATGRTAIEGHPNALYWKMTSISTFVCLLGYVDDRISLRPRVKLAGQIVAGFLVWAWAGLGFNDLWPWLPVWLDCVLTVFWIVGAVNAFNLIDGLDGLASGLALIATVGMAGALFFANHASSATLFCALAGALVAFLRYNYNPASVFLGDAGSMYLGFMLATLPLATHRPNSFLVSVGVPLLAMGVPIFDTALAIVRRSLRHLLVGRGDGKGQVMTADLDHLHHRILRAVGFSQRRAAWTLYAIAVALVLVGFAGVLLESRAAGLWCAALALAAYIAVSDLARIELFDAGRILAGMAHEKARAARRRWARLRVPLYVLFDVLALVAVFFLVQGALMIPVVRATVRVSLAIRTAAMFVALVVFRTYVTVWSRALLSNYVRLFLACVFGALAGAVVVYYVPSASNYQIRAFTLAYAAASFVALASVRVIRGVIRDFFYALDCARLKARKDVSRVLVYGAGLRYRTFRRDLVRTTAANDRMVVGLLDDDILLRGHYIGGVKVLGTLADAPAVINAVNADAVVVCCDVPDSWLKIVRETLAPTGVRVSVFRYAETPLGGLPISGAKSV